MRLKLMRACSRFASADLVGRLGGGRLADIGLPLLHGDRDVVELQSPRHFGVRVFGDRSRLLDRRLRLPDGDGIVPRVDQHQEIALVDELVVGDRQFHDLAGDLQGRFSRHRRGPCRRASMARPCNIARPASRAAAATATATAVTRIGRTWTDDKTDRRLIAGRAFASLAFKFDAGHQRLQRAIITTIDETIIT